MPVLTRCSDGSRSSTAVARQRSANRHRQAARHRRSQYDNGFDGREPQLPGWARQATGLDLRSSAAQDSPLPATCSTTGVHPAMRRLSKRTALVHLRVVVAHDALDTALAQGADPSRRPELAIRAAQLVRPRHRRALARTLRGVIAEANRPPASARSTAAVICRHQIRAHADEVLALAGRLDNPRLAYASGIAIAQRLITDVLESPIYVACDSDRLRDLVDLAVTGMDDPTVHLAGGLSSTPA